MLYNNVKTICKKKGTNPTKIEKDLGFSNGSICKWNESDPGISKVQKVAAYLGISIDELLKE